MTGVIYARYSSDNQREESIEGQIRENTAFAEKNGIVIVGHYIDRAVSAKTDNRPEFQRMIRDSAKKTFDVVIVWKLDRFSLYDDKLVITFNFKNEPVTVPTSEEFEAIEQSSDLFVDLWSKELCDARSVQWRGVRNKASHVPRGNNNSLLRSLPTA